MLFQADEGVVVRSHFFSLRIMANSNDGLLVCAGKLVIFEKSVRLNSQKRV